MTHLATLNAPLTALGPRTERIEHRLALPRLAREAGADHYVVIDVAGRHGDSGIVAADWTFDAVLDVGRDALVRIAESSLVSGFGAAAHIFEPFELVTENGLLSAAEAAALRDHGHHEFTCLKLRSGGAKLVALLSCGRTRHLDKAALPRFQVMASYHLSERGETPCASDTCELLSERERECLRWVSHGKTTDEVAGILEVSPNTVNSYVAHAVKKLSVRNRPMAIAALIRAGLI